MGKSHIRVDKTCLNCNHVVEKRFCSNCGQENAETRKTFHHLFIHFFEDLTHYENAFWKTMRNLLFRPSALSKEYLSGKRMSYLAPVRLYIFISFITFFLIAVIPSRSKEALITFNKKDSETEFVSKKISLEEQEIDALLKTNGLSKNVRDTILERIIKNKKSSKTSSAFGYKSIQEFDSLQKFGTEDDKVPKIFHKFIKNAITNAEKYSPEEITEKLFESILHNFPKVLLIYMPIFAFFLWLFHDKKKWYYFDHGIFTLHYFSFLLLISLLLFLARSLLNLVVENEIVTFISRILSLVSYIWMIYYFFPAHHRFYGETRLTSFIKSSILFIINMILIVILMLLFFIYSFTTIH